MQSRHQSSRLVPFHLLQRLQDRPRGFEIPNEGPDSRLYRARQRNGNVPVMHKNASPKIASGAVVDSGTTVKEANTPFEPIEDPSASYRSVNACNEN
jgi:hypothetical protein